MWNYLEHIWSAFALKISSLRFWLRENIGVYRGKWLCFLDDKPVWSAKQGNMQDEFPVVEYLISDDAPEYKKLAKIIHGLCWVHDARFYKKIIPKIDRHKEILSEVMRQYWDFYDALLVYKESSKEYQHLQKELIKQEFDNIFNQKTDYYQVNECLERTQKNKDKLLVVLDNPALPLHNRLLKRWFSNQ